MRFTSLTLRFLLAFTLAPVMAASGPKRDTLEDYSRDAYIWGYPAVLLKKTRESMLGTENVSAKLNHFFHSSQVRDPNLRDLTGGNSDSLFSWAWIELGHKPLVLVQPSLKDRFSALIVVDAFSNVVSFKNGMDLAQGSEIYYLTGPQWKGRLPVGAKQIVSGTSEVLVLAQAFVRDSKDAANVAGVMKKHQLVAWDDWQNGVRQDMANLTAPKSRVLVQKNLAAPGLSFFEDLRQILAKNELGNSDLRELERFEVLGISDKASFTNKLSDPDARGMIERGLYEGEREINTRVTAGVGNKVNGWRFEMKAIPSEEDFLLRAAIAKERFFSVPSKQVVQLRVEVDSESRQLNSAYAYELRFEKEDLPSARAGWSLSAVPSRGRGLSDKSRQIYSVSESTLRTNSDGSVVVMIQSEPPARGRRTNWLPLPANTNFALVLSAYSPGNSILQSRYIAPSLVRLDEDSVPQQQRIVRRMMAFSK